VVGAGVSGLLAARELSATGGRVVVLDEGRDIGGLMATQRMGNGTFDHGAQFFTVRSERFERPVAGWQEAGVVEEWTRGYAGAEGRHNNEGYPRYPGSVGMNSVSKHLARCLDVRTGERALQVTGQDGAWETRTASGRREIGAALLPTAPVPQSLTLLRSACVELPDEVGYKLESYKLENISYFPCLTLMALLDAG
jgi:predicted NAD/FAD-dependent oxidoreductase